MSNIKFAGSCIFLAGAIILMGIITAEAFYPPGYSTANSEISDLGATVPPNSVTHQPAATIFNFTMLVSGLLLLSAVFFQHRANGKWGFTIPFFLLAAGMVGVGIFPGNKVPYHGICSLLTFIMGGLSAVFSFKIVGGPYKFIGMLLGSITIIVLFTADSFIPIIGDGGTERWVAYPVVLWLTGLGGYLTHDTRAAIVRNLPSNLLLKDRQV